MVEKSKLDDDKDEKAVDPSHYRAFADADHAGFQDTRRSTSGSLQFLGDRLIRTMDITIDQQVALDEALVPHARRLRIRRSNFRLLSDISSKESTLQLVYDVLQQTPFFKAFLVTADVPDIYMQEFWATDTVHYHSIRFKMDNKKNSDAYKEYYAVATGATLPKTKASVRKTKSSSDTTVTPPSTAAAGTRLFTSAKGKQPATTSKAKSLTSLSEVPDVPTEESDEEISWKSSDEGDDDDDDEGDDGNDDEEGDGDDDDEGYDDDDDAQDDDADQENANKDDDEERDDDDYQEEGSDDEQAFDEEGKQFIYPSLSTYDEEETRDEESFDPIPKTPENIDDEGNGEENLGINVGREEGQDIEDEEDELYRDVNINLGRGVQMADVHTTQEFKDSHVTLTPVNPDGQQQSSSVSSQFVTSMLNLTLDAGIESIFETTSQVDLQTPTSVAPLPVSAPTLTPSTIATITIVQQAPAPSITAHTATRSTQLWLFAGAVSSILEIVQRYMDQRMNEAVKVEVLTRSSNSSKTSYAVAVDLSEMELKKILIEKMEGNKSIHRSNKQRNLYKALVEAYESGKIILDTYEDTVTLKRRHDDDANQTGGPRDEEKERSQSQQALQRRKLQGALASRHKGLNLDKRANDQPIAEPSQHPEWFSQQKKPPTPDHDWNKTLPATHGSIQPWISELAKQTDSRSSFNELMDTPVDFSAFLMNRLKVETLTPELLAGPTYELMKVSCKSLVELEFFLEEVYKATTDQLDWVNPEGKQYPHNLLKPLPLIPNSRGRRVIPFDHFINNDLEYLRGVASSRKYTTSVTKTKAADYEHIKWIEDLVPRTM
nr:hypothetical protein [Tanacetum cinerariifolium]